jgi:hypothetical protein
MDSQRLTAEQCAVTRTKFAGEADLLRNGNKKVVRFESHLLHRGRRRNRNTRRPIDGIRGSLSGFA